MDCIDSLFSLVDSFILIIKISPFEGLEFFLVDVSVNALKGVPVLRGSLSLFLALCLIIKQKKNQVLTYCLLCFLCLINQSWPFKRMEDSQRKYTQERRKLLDHI